MKTRESVDVIDLAVALSSIPLLPPKGLQSLLTRVGIGLAARAHYTNFNPGPPAREHLSRQLQRMAHTVAEITLAINRIADGLAKGRFTSESWFPPTPFETVRMAATADPTHLSDVPSEADAIRMPTLDDSTPLSDVPIPRAKRTRGAQPGNRNRLVHGRRSKAGRHFLAENRAFIGLGRHLVRTVQVRLAAIPPP